MLPAPAFPVPPPTNALPAPPPPPAMEAEVASFGPAVDADAAIAAASPDRWLRDTLRMWSVIGSILQATTAIELDGIRLDWIPYTA